VLKSLAWVPDVFCWSHIECDLLMSSYIIGIFIAMPKNILWSPCYVLNILEVFETLISVGLGDRWEVHSAVRVFETNFVVSYVE
jgi:hypothetical protein